MVTYKFNCDKCTNKYYGCADGNFGEWCKPMVDGKKPLEWEQEDKKVTVCKCRYYTEKEGQEAMYLPKARKDG